MEATDSSKNCAVCGQRCVRVTVVTPYSGTQVAKLLRAGSCTWSRELHRWLPSSGRAVPRVVLLIGNRQRAEGLCHSLPDELWLEILVRIQLTPLAMRPLAGKLCPLMSVASAKVQLEALHGYPTRDQQLFAFHSFIKQLVVGEVALGNAATLATQMVRPGIQLRLAIERKQHDGEFDWCGDMAAGWAACCEDWSCCGSTDSRSVFCSANSYKHLAVH